MHLLGAGTLKARQQHTYAFLSDCVLLLHLGSGSAERALPPFSSDKCTEWRERQAFCYSLATPGNSQ